MSGGGRMDTLTEREGIASDWIQSIAEDCQVDLWIGTNGGGLSRAERRRLRDLYHARRPVH